MRITFFSALGKNVFMDPTRFDGRAYYRLDAV